MPARITNDFFIALYCCPCRWTGSSNLGFYIRNFSQQNQSSGQSFGASVHWVFAAIITLITPFFLDDKDGVFKDNPWPIFAFFAG
jgi:hypothetical protein